MLQSKLGTLPYDNPPSPWPWKHPEELFESIWVEEFEHLKSSDFCILGKNANPSYWEVVPSSRLDTAASSNWYRSCFAIRAVTTTPAVLKWSLFGLSWHAFWWKFEPWLVANTKMISLRRLQKSPQEVAKTTWNKSRQVCAWDHSPIPNGKGPKNCTPKINSGVHLVAYICDETTCSCKVLWKMERMADAAILTRQNMWKIHSRK